MRRTQILLEDAQYDRLRTQSKATGTSIGELVRRAVDQVYGLRSSEEQLRALDESFGGASDEDFDGLDGSTYVEQQRRGLDRRCNETTRS